MESSIQFADAPRPRKSNEIVDVGGVVPLRVRSHSRGRKSSFDIFKEDAIETAEDEDAGLRNSNDFKHKQVWFCRRSNTYVSC